MDEGPPGPIFFELEKIKRKRKVNDKKPKKVKKWNKNVHTIYKFFTHSNLFIVCMKFTNDLKV